jgi:pilus assembly protein Flp/PilA
VEIIVKNIAKRFISDESGATAIEYGMVAAMIGVAIVGIFSTFKTNLTTAFTTLGTGLNTQTTKLGAATN